MLKGFKWSLTTAQCHILYTWGILSPSDGHHTQSATQRSAVARGNAVWRISIALYTFSCSAELPVLHVSAYAEISRADRDQSTSFSRFQLFVCVRRALEWNIVRLMTIVHSMPLRICASFTNAGVTTGSNWWLIESLRTISGCLECWPLIFGRTLCYRNWRLLHYGKCARTVLIHELSGALRASEFYDTKQRVNKTVHSFFHGVFCLLYKYCDIYNSGSK